MKLLYFYRMHRMHRGWGYGRIDALRNAWRKTRHA